MHAIDRAILEFCAEEFRALSALRQQIALGTLYRHVTLLCRLDLLEKQSTFYRTTERGRRALVTASTERTFDGFAEAYAPIAAAPTSVHRAMAELIFAAVVARHHKIRPDRHPFFVAAGQTLRWKTSLGQFCCHALGLDSAKHLVECGSETGKSLFIRRDHSGDIISKRELLDAPFLVLDEFLSAEPSVRPSLQLFLTGRLEVPFENSRLTVKPVPLLTLNVRERNTLEEQLGLSAPQIRRGLIANFDAVQMPDLALVGDGPVLAAQQSKPLRLDPPTVDCESYQRIIVQTVRQILTPAAQSRVDVQVVMTLCSGMTAFIRDAGSAIVQVIYGVGLMAETMEWTNPGWIETLLNFSTTHGHSAVKHRDIAASVLPAQGKPTTHAGDPVSRPTTIPLQVPPLRRETTPSLAVSEALKNRLIWAAVDTGQSLEECLNTLLDLYLMHRKDSNTITILTRVLRIADHLQLAEIEVGALQKYVAAETTLRRAGLWMDDVPEALQLLPLLEGLPESWTWEQAQRAMRAVAYVVRHDIDPNTVGEFFAFHRALERCGINEQYLVELVTALEEAGVHGPRKKKTLDRVIAQAAQHVDVEELQHQAQGLADKIECLEAQREKLSGTIEEGQRGVEALIEQETTLHDRLDALAGELAAYEQERTMLHAVRSLVENGKNALTQQSPSVPQYGEWWEQLISALHGEPNAGSEKGTT